MRRIRLILAVVAVMAAMLTALPGPAMADDFFDFDDDFDNGCFSGNGFFFDNCFFDDGFFNFDGGGISLEVDQEAESGDVTIGNNVSNG